MSKSGNCTTDVDHDPAGMVLRGTSENEKEPLCKLKLDDLLYFAICFLSLAVVPLAGMAAFSEYYNVSVNRQPVTESVLTDLDCNDLDPSVLQHLNETVCSTDPFTTSYTLFEKDVQYFNFEPRLGMTFCRDNDEETEDQAFQEHYPFDLMTFGNNIGLCSKTTLKVAEACACSAFAFALLGTFWFTVLGDHYRYSKGAAIHIGLSILTMVFATITAVIYTSSIDPLRDSIGQSFCERQSTFQDCEETMGDGFFFTISTCVAAFLIVVAYLLKFKFNSSTSPSSTEESDLDVEEDSSHNSGSDGHNLCLQIDFWVKLGRFLELFLAILSFMTNFTTLQFSLFDADNTPIRMPSYLWSDQFCQSHFFAIDTFLLLNLNDSNDDASTIQNFGDCDPSELIEVYTGFAKILLFGGLALFLKRDAARNPLFYIAGLISDFMTIVFVAMAIDSFVNEIYPGRSAIEPSFCDQYNIARETLGYATDVVDDCNIRFGIGFYLLLVVQALTVINFVVEFIIAEIGVEYGAANAVLTVYKRVRRGEIKHAIVGSASVYHQQKSPWFDTEEMLPDDTHTGEARGIHADGVIEMESSITAQEHESHSFLQEESSSQKDATD